MQVKKTKTPKKPNSSAKEAKIKSVCRSGKKFKCDCVPSLTPLPQKPPDPTAIVA